MFFIQSSSSYLKNSVCFVYFKFVCMISSFKIVFFFFTESSKKFFFCAWYLVIGCGHLFLVLRDNRCYLWCVFLSVTDLGPVLSRLAVKGLHPIGIGISRHAVRQGDGLLLVIVLLSDHRHGMCAF